MADVAGRITVDGPCHRIRTPFAGWMTWCGLVVDHNEVRQLQADGDGRTAEWAGETVPWPWNFFRPDGTTVHEPVGEPLCPECERLGAFVTDEGLRDPG